MIFVFFFLCLFFFFQAEDGIRDRDVTGVQTCALRSLLSNTSVGSGLLLLSDTLMDWLTENCTLVDLSLSSSSSDGASVDSVSLLLLEAKGSCLIQS